MTKAAQAGEVREGYRASRIPGALEVEVPLPTTYKLREEIIGIRDGMRIVTVPENALLEVSGEGVVSGLIDLMWEGESVAIFAYDLQTSASVVKS